MHTQKISKHQKLHNSIFPFLDTNYVDKDLSREYFGLDEINLCLDCEDESGSNGFWDATCNFIKRIYNIDFINANDEAFEEQQRLYYVLSAMRDFYFHDEFSKKINKMGGVEVMDLTLLELFAERIANEMSRIPNADYYEYYPEAFGKSKELLKEFLTVMSGEVLKEFGYSTYLQEANYESMKNPLNDSKLYVQGHNDALQQHKQVIERIETIIKNSFEKVIKCEE